MVRNEADIIEAFVRHNLAFVDGLAIFDHRSTDRTPAILAQLKAEGLPIMSLSDPEEGFYQASRVTTLARECFARTDAAFALVLDADEFLRAESRAVIEQVLGQLPPDVHATQEWRSYVPTSFRGPFGAQCLRMRVREERLVREKVIVPRSMSDRADEMVSEGSHGVVDMRTLQRRPYVRIPSELMTLAHCPIRSAAQFASKVRHGWPALKAAGGAGITIAYHWRDFHAELERGIELSDEWLRVVAANYSYPREMWVPADRIELVEDPVRLRDVRGPRGRSRWAGV